MTLVAGVLFVVVGGGEAEASEVILEPVASGGQDPFFDSVATSAVEVQAGGVEQVAGGSGAVESLGGDTPGLYGGTGQDAVCDPGALVGFLEEHRAKATAFARPLGISPRDIAEYVGGLTPVVLREDTRVTNHGFKDGQATPLQSVLQAGTAVLVDDLGVPRVRCACGNPLAEPAAVGGEPDYVGTRWGGFDETRLIAVSAAPGPLPEFELVDVDTGEAYEQRVGSGMLMLAQDGLGLVAFGTQEDETIRLLTEEMGPPEEEHEIWCGVGSESSNPQPSGTLTIWDRLRISTGESAGFFSWTFSIRTIDNVPMGDSELTTPEGLDQSMTIEDFKRTYAPDESEVRDPEGWGMIHATPTFAAILEHGELVSITAAASEIDRLGVPEICAYLD
jgi:hypothetical protein